MKQNKFTNKWPSGLHINIPLGLKKWIAYLLLIFSFTVTNAQSTVKEIKQKMAQIRQNTDWDNPAQAQKANTELDKLSKQLYSASRQTQPGADSSKQKLDDKIFDEKLKSLNNIFEQAAKSKDSSLDLAKPVREEIVQAYKDDEDQTVNSPDFAQSLPYLEINTSMPGIQAVIDQMPNFRGIKVLVITSGNKPMPANIQAILKNAEAYPLEGLYITGFGLFFTKIPDAVFRFGKLKVLGLYNNKIVSVPAGLSGLSQLKELYIDMNPVTSLLPWINSLGGLEKIGIGKTKILPAEITALKKRFPGCQFLEQ